MGKKREAIVDVLQRKSVEVKEVFTSAITNLGMVNDEIEVEVQTATDEINELQAKKNKLEAIKSENENLRSKLMTFFS